MENWEVAAALERIAGLLSIKGENQYKSRAYSMASRQINRLACPLKQLAVEGRLQEIPGVGDALEKKIEELISTGNCRFLTELESEVPPQLLALYEIPGVGLKTAHKLYAGLELRSLRELEQAAREGRLQSIPGLGSNLRENILAFFEQRPRYAETFHRGIALPLARQWVRRLQELPGVVCCRASGALRRGTETVTEALLVAGIEESRRSAFKEALAEVVPGELREEAAGGSSRSPFSAVSFRTPSGLPVHLLQVPEECLAIALLWSTGSSYHWEQLVSAARQKGLVLSACGLQEQDGGKELPVDREEEIYRELELPFIPPELRENPQVIELGRQGKLPDLLELSQIRGDLHLHSNWSDGFSSIPELAAGAAARGYSYLAITDHSPSLQIAGGLSIRRLKEQIAEIRKFNRSGSSPCYLFPGMEVDILEDGSLDLPDELLYELELVVASVHSNFRLSRQEMTGRICRAMAHPAVHIIGHPTGRLLGSRGGYQVDLDQVITRAAATGTALEI
ncbi:MAG TPA: DNA polymerase/3'-5' exonuclease PolX, partial [Firmicutes bacterium]|nr:DNA polymerase/3'-5' exonuclease PolX [Bacillota bacterium]